MPTINFGIDLGTTNSLIARFDKGAVDVFKNPTDFKETLPSVVGFRNDRILIGGNALRWTLKDPKNVVSRFKRKMGTSESFKIKSLGQSKTPVELSAYVLKELKGFVRSGESVDAAVITIPASFDTVQSNATKEAGLQAGFKSVVLLQEPIAASLAFANKERNLDLRNSRWLVYDLGGGTFDVALVRIVEGELTVVDHEGDNFLGGSDFDEWIVEKLVVPQLMKRGRFENLIDQMKSESGRYNALWHSLLQLAEGAKVELSNQTSAEIDLASITVTDDDGKVIDDALVITRSEFEELIKESVEGTVEMIRRILTRNSLQPRDLQFMLMVGGSTYIPFVRQRVGEVLGIQVNTSIDPTNAIVVGAAYYAGAKEWTQTATTPSASTVQVRVRAAYNRSSQEKEEVFTAKVEGAPDGCQYRITSDDGAFDSGLKKVTGRIVEDLPLREGAFNLFTLRLIDSHGNQVPIDLESIQIAQGRYSVAGQVLPEDISLVKDAPDGADTILQSIFHRSSVLPSRQKMVVEVARTVIKGAEDQVIHVMVVEGPSDRHSSTNKPIGVLSITGAQISRDLIKGTEIDLTFEMSESRDLTCSAYLNGTGQEFSQVFKPTQRNVSPRMLASEILLLEEKVQSEVDDAQKSGNHAMAEKLERVLSDVQGLIGQGAIQEDDSTDRRFQVEDQKRRLAQQVYELTSAKRIEKAREEYRQARTAVAELVRKSGNDSERHIVEEIIAREPTFLGSANPEKIGGITLTLENLRWRILSRTPEFLIGMFEHLNERRASMNDQMQAKQLFDNGRRAIQAEEWDGLRPILGRLLDLLPNDIQAIEQFRAYTGIV